MNQKYAIVFFLKKNTVQAQFPASQWPLHLTFLGGINLPAASTDQFLASLEAYTKDLGPFFVLPSTRALYGPNQNIVAMSIVQSTMLRAMHEDFLEMVDKYGGTVDEPQYTHNNFIPHVTEQANDKVQEGVPFQITDYTLVDMNPDGDPNQRRVVKSYLLSGQYEA